MTEKNYIYTTVYKSNYYICKATEQPFTVCKNCNEYIYIAKDSNGYCSSCESPLGDYDGDLIDAQDIENMQFSYMKLLNEKTNKLDEMVQSLFKGEELNLIDYIKTVSNNVGVRHKDFSKDNGYLVSTHLVEKEFEAFGEIYTEVTWKAGFVVKDEIFEKVKNGDYSGFSFGAKGYKSKINDIGDVANNV